jgi:hypothetical protein
MLISRALFMVEERRERIKKAIYKALYYANNSLEVSGDIPSTREESQFLIGLVTRYTHWPECHLEYDHVRLRQLCYAGELEKSLIPSESICK